MRKFAVVVAGLMLLLTRAPLWAQPKPAAGEDHLPSFRGLQIGMKLAHVLDLLEPLPYTGKDSKEGMVLLWKLEDESTLEVSFHQERVASFYLRYRDPRPAGDLQLERVANFLSGNSLNVNDPRLRRDYQIREPIDKNRYVWARQEMTRGGYQIEVGFVSPSRLEYGENFAELVEFKYVSVPRSEVKNFEQAIQAGQAEAGITTSAHLRLEVDTSAEKDQQQSVALTEEDHLPSIQGVRVGMTAQQVVDTLGRMPNGRKDESDRVVVSWNLVNGDVLEVHFRQENVWQVGLRLKQPRPSTDLWLQPLSQPPPGGTLDNLGRQTDGPAASSGAAPPATPPVGGALVINPYPKRGTGPVTARDPRWRNDYKPTETNDRHRAVWTRQIKTEDGYRVEIRFLSVSRERQGDRFEEYVEFKHVTVPKEDLENFDKAYRPR